MTALTAEAAPSSMGWKFGVAVGLVALADVLLWNHEPGALFGVFLLTWVVAIAVVLPGIRRDRRALIALAASAFYAAVMIEEIHPLAALLFGTAISMAALLPLTSGFDDAWRWFQRLAFNAVSSVIRPITDLQLAQQTSAKRGLGLSSLASMIWLPLAGGVVFLVLFALANPIIGDMLARLKLPAPARFIFWGAVFGAIWSVFRPRLAKRVLGLGDEAKALPGVSVISVTISLVLFNALFAVQNGLDLAFLWSGAPLPEGVTPAEYVHRGAYPLIVTALLAGLFVIVTLRPGSATAESRLIRWLVVMWTVQNLLLVASSVLRTVDYIEVYSLTPLRLAGLIWMGVVAAGLTLICWRLARGKSEAWLINANALVAGLVLSAACVVDLGAVSAAWNISHAREVGGKGAPLDVCFLAYLGGSSALVSLAKLERRTTDPALLDSVSWARERAMTNLAKRQADPHGWSWRGARRLAAARALVGDAPPRTHASQQCRDGRLTRPAVVLPTLPAPTPLTSAPGG